jgi:hypothetical protein
MVHSLPDLPGHYFRDYSIVSVAVFALDATGEPRLSN